MSEDVRTPVEPHRRPHPPLVTLGLIGLNVAVFVAMVASGVPFFEPTVEQALHWGADFGPYTLAGEWWRIGTSMFLHFGILHLALNMWALLNLGWLAEALFGRATFLMLYAVSGVGGGLASLLVHPLVVGGGASGAIFGVAGGLITGLLLKRESSVLLAALRKRLPSLASFVLWNLLGGLAISGIDNMAHVGGLVTGAAFGAAILRPAADEAPPSARMARTFALFAIALGIGANVVKRVDAVKISAALSQVDTLANTDLPPSVAARLSKPSSLPATAPSDLVAQIPRLERLVASHPESIRAAVDLASAYLRSERIPEAIAALQRARERAPGDTALLATLGTAYLDARRYDDAVGAFRTAFDADSSNRDARYNLASAYDDRAQALAASGANARARADFKQVLRLGADSALDREAREGLRAAGP